MPHRCTLAAVVLAAVGFVAGCYPPGDLRPSDGDFTDLHPCDVDPTTACADFAGTTCADIIQTSIAAKCVPDDFCDRVTCAIGECLFDKDAKFPNVRCICGDDPMCSKAAEAERDDELREKQILD